MFTILNRLRGSGDTPLGAPWQISLLIGFISFYLFSNPYVAVLMALGYYAGESMGWGAWVGTLTTHRYEYSDDTPPEGSKEGIHWLASKIVDPYKNWYRYSQVALTIRGIYWWTPVLLPLYFVSFPVTYILVAILLLGITFPLACEIGYHTTKYWNFKFMSGAWEHQEVWYGAFQDIILFCLILL